MTPLVLPPPPAGAVLVAGACLLDMSLDAAGDVDVELGQPTWAVNGTGGCLVTGQTGLLTGSLTGSLTGAHDTSGGCAAGVYTGSLAFEVPGAFGRVDSFVAVAVMAGPVLKVTMVTPLTFAGTGIFAELSTDATAACPLGTNDVTIWKGAFAFEDPTV